MKQPTSITRTIVRAAFVVASTLALGACISIPQKAWSNGEAMTSSRAFQSRMNGDYSIQNGRRLQSTYNNAHGFDYKEPPPYAPFGAWQY